MLTPGLWGPSRPVFPLQQEASWNSSVHFSSQERGLVLGHCACAKNWDLDFWVGRKGISHPNSGARLETLEEGVLFSQLPKQSDEYNLPKPFCIITALKILPVIWTLLMAKLPLGGSVERRAPEVPAAMFPHRQRLDQPL